MVRDGRVMKVKVCLIGDHAVGKTSLIKRFVYDEFDDRYILTVGAKITKKVIEVEHPTGEGIIEVAMTIWDISGQKGFRELLKEAYFQGAQGLIAVSDVTRKDTLSELDGWISSVERMTGKIPIHFLANKIDLNDQMRFGERELAETSGSYSSPHLLTSAKTGENVELAFKDLSQRIVAQRLSRRLPLSELQLSPPSTNPFSVS